MTGWTVCLAAWTGLLATTVPCRRPPRRDGPGRRDGWSSLGSLIRGRRRGRDRRARAAELAAATDLLAVGLSVGMNVRDAIETLVRHGGDDLGCGLGAVVGSVRAGSTLDDALAEWAGSFGPPADELASVLVAADRRGVAVGPTLERLAGDLRRRRRREAEAAARRLTVRMLLPLVCCILPAFGLVVVAPMVAVGLGDALGAV